MGKAAELEPGGGEGMGHGIVELAGAGMSHARPRAKDRNNGGYFMMKLGFCRLSEGRGTQPRLTRKAVWFVFEFIFHFKRLTD